MDAFIRSHLKFYYLPSISRGETRALIGGGGGWGGVGVGA